MSWIRFEEKASQRTRTPSSRRRQTTCIAEMLAELAEQNRSGKSDGKDKQGSYLAPPLVPSIAVQWLARYGDLA
jgi:hypothetical protein